MEDKYRRNPIAKLMANWKIMTKLQFAFLVIAALAVAVGTYCLRNMALIEGQFEYVEKNHTEPRMQLWQARSAMAGARIDTLRHVVERDSQKMQELELQIRDFDAQVDTHLAKVEKSSLTEEEKTGLEDVKSKWSTYKTMRDSQTLTLSRSGKKDEARAATTGVVSVAFIAVTDAMDRLGEAKLRATDAALTSSAKDYADTRSATEILLLVSVVLSLALGYLISHMIADPLRGTATVLDQVASGDLTGRLQIDGGDEVGVMAKALNRCVDTLNSVSSEITRMHAGQAAGDIDVFAAEEQFTGTYRQIVTAANDAVRSHITGILQILDLIGAYAEGDFNRELPEFPGKRIIATQRVNKLRNNLLGVISEMTRMAEAQKAGDIEAYVPEEKFAGAWRELAAGANEGVRLHVENILKILGILASYAEGDFNPMLEKLPGKQVIVNEKMDLLRNNLQRVSKDVNELTEAILNGKLAARGGAEAFSGDWRKLVGGINLLIEAFVEPINLVADYVDRIGKGDIPAKITDTYQGDFNNLKNNLNACLDGLGGLVETNRVLQRITLNDYTLRVEGHYEGIFAEVAQATNEAESRLVNLQKIAQNVASGAYEEDLAELKKIGRRCENDHQMPAFIQMMEAIDATVADAQMLSKAAVQGDLARRADASKHRGKYRQVIDGVNQTLDAVTAPIQESGQVLQRIAGGDLTARVQGDYKGDHAAMKNDINTMAETLSASMGSIGQNSQALASSAEQLTAVSQQMTSNAEETSAQSNVVSAAAEQVTKNLQTVATATEEMTASIKEIAKNANEAAAVATAAVKTAETTNATVAKLGQASNEIGQVIKVITSIAQQTNLLALNATIEAARAGEAGKGFAVVANEVKELAKETAKATEDITQKIEAIQSDTKGAVDAIGEISTVITQINDISNTIASAVEEQTATTNEIARNVTEAAEGGKQVGQNIEAVATAAKSTTSGASDTQNAASELARMAAELQTLVGQFKFDGAGGAPARAPNLRPGAHASRAA